MEEGKSYIELYIRNIIFGVVDSLVSTVGLLSGVDISGTPKSVVVLTGVVYAFVEAFSMAVGSFLSEQSAQNYKMGSETSAKLPLVGGSVMFVSFLLSSFVPILPYILNMPSPFGLSIAFSFVALFAVGAVNAQMTRVGLFKHALKTVLLGGIAIIVGIVVGKVVHAG